MTNRNRQLAGGFFALGLFAVAELILNARIGTSFTKLLFEGNTISIVVFAAGCVIGMAWEYVGQFALEWWHYPPIQRHRWLFALLPVFWGIFMLIMQDGYALARTLGLAPLAAVLVSTLTIGFLIEGINLYTRSWVYSGWMSSLPLLAIGWIFFLASTFVIGFNTYFINPFGL